MFKFKLIFVSLILMLSFSAANAQEGPDNPPPDRFDGQNRPNLMRELGLTPEQVQQIRFINGENRDKMRDAQFRLREAHRNLDQAIYADKVDEQLVRTRLRELVEAQAEIARIRTMTELAIRKVLTPEQLIRFRELRQRFAERRQNRQARPQDFLRNKPNQKFNKRQKPPFKQ
ncbi:MAG TPA: periplasmic heavy metal sensor [Pyrinomonadaceae bacterium]|nr:periplasmic heavy metal sensor [Pyrinomonadaceae bacterium]